MKASLGYKVRLSLKNLKKESGPGGRKRRGRRGGREGVSLFCQCLRPTMASRTYLSGQRQLKFPHVLWGLPGISLDFWLGCGTTRSSGPNAANPELHISALQATCALSQSLPVSEDFLCSEHCSRKMHNSKIRTGEEGPYEEALELSPERVERNVPAEGVPKTQRGEAHLEKTQPGNPGLG